MRPVTLALVAAIAFTSSGHAQTVAQAPAPAASTAAVPSASSGKERLGGDCEEEVKDACGRAQGDEMQNCIKSSLDLNRFSDACKSELVESTKPNG